MPYCPLQGPWSHHKPSVHVASQPGPLDAGQESIWQQGAQGGATNVQWQHSIVERSPSLTSAARAGWVGGMTRCRCVEYYFCERPHWMLQPCSNMSLQWYCLPTSLNPDNVPPGCHQRSRWYSTVPLLDPAQRRGWLPGSSHLGHPPQPVWQWDIMRPILLDTFTVFLSSGP